MTDRELRDDLSLLAQQIAILARAQRSPLARAEPMHLSFTVCPLGCILRHAYVKSRTKGWYVINVGPGEWSVLLLDRDPDTGYWTSVGVLDQGGWEDGPTACVQALVDLEERYGPLEGGQDPNEKVRYQDALFDCDDEYLCDAWLQQALRET